MTRIIWIDYAKIFGLFLVIFAHLYTSEGTSESNVVRTYIYGFHMPFFFLISGMLHKQRKEKLKEALIKNLKSLFVPYLVFNLLFAFIYGITEPSNSILSALIQIPKGIIKGSGTPCKASWFVMCLFLIKCIFDIFNYKKIKKYGIPLLFIFTLLPFKLPYFYFSSACLGLMFYYLGYALKDDIIKMNLKPILCIPISVIAFTVSYYLTQINGKVSMLIADTGNHAILFYINALIGSLGIIALAMIFNKIERKMIINISVASIGIVLTHMYLVGFVIEYKPLIISTDLYLFAYYTLASILIYAICAIFFHLSRKYIPLIWGKF